MREREKGGPSCGIARSELQHHTRSTAEEHDVRPASLYEPSSALVAWSSVTPARFATEAHPGDGAAAAWRKQVGQRSGGRQWRGGAGEGCGAAARGKAAVRGAEEGCGAATWGEERGGRGGGENLGEGGELEVGGVEDVVGGGACLGHGGGVTVRVEGGGRSPGLGGG